MPTAQPFKTLGRGNGFPFCGGGVDLTSGVVSSTDGTLGPANAWITLGGVSSGTASQAQIDLSMRNAMKLYYNSYSVTVANLSSSSSGESSFTSSQSTSVAVNNKEAIYKKYVGQDRESDYLPIDRICNNPEIVRSSSISFSDSDQGENRLNESRISFAGNPGAIIKMYNGSTNNESNFVGWGAINVANSSARTSLFLGSNAGAINTSAKVQVGSFFRGEEKSGLDSHTGEEVDIKFFNCNLGGMNFISYTTCKSKARASSSSGSTIVDSANASALSGTASSTFQSGAGGNSAEGESQCEASISGLGFYTY